MTGQLRFGQIFKTGISIHRYFHQFVQRLQRSFCLLETHSQRHYLSQRGGCTTGEHHGGNQRPHGQLTGIDQIHPEHNQHHRLYLLKKHHHAAGYARQLSRLHRRTRSQRTEHIPAPLHIGLTAYSLEGFQTSDGLDQQALLEASFTQVFFHRARQRPLDSHTDQHNQRDQQQWHPTQRAADNKDHTDKHQYKWQIGDRHQSG